MARGLSPVSAVELAPERSGDRVRQLRALLRGITTGMLTTVSADGEARSRPMLLMQLDPPGRLWFMTDIDSRKAEDVAQECAVNVSFISPRGDRYVSVSGRATLVRDERKIKELWRPTYRAWYPRGTRDPEIVLLVVDVDRADYWLVPTSRLVRIVCAIRALLTRQRYEAGTRGTIEFSHPRAA